MEGEGGGCGGGGAVVVTVVRDGMAWCVNKREKEWSLVRESSVREI